MSIQYAPINKNSGQEWNASGTVYLLRVGSETTAQAAARKTADNSLTVLTNLPDSVIIDNPNEEMPPVVPSMLNGGFAEGTISELMAQAPFTPTTNQFSSWGYGGNTRKFIDNGTIKIGYAKGLGGALDYISDSGGPNLVNNNSSADTSIVEGDEVPDVGRQAGPSMYGTPLGSGYDPFYDSSDYMGGIIQEANGIGWNGVPGGSIFQDHSAILHYQRVVSGGVTYDYIKTQPTQWELHAVPAEMYLHSYYWLEGRAIRYFYIIENWRTDTQMHFMQKGQEMPFVYTIAPYHFYKVYQGNNPFTSDSTVNIDLPEPCEGSDEGCNQHDTGPNVSTEHWIGSLNSSNHGVFIVTPYNSQFNGKQLQSWFGDENSNATAYINATTPINFDIPGHCYAFTGYIYVGQYSEFRPWLNALNFDRVPLDYTFAPNKTAFWSSSAPCNFNPSNGNQYEWALGTIHDGNPNSGFSSPWGSWKASDITTIYIKYKISTTSAITQMNFSWNKGDEPFTVSHSKTFSVIADNNVHTAVLTMTGTPNWDEIIVQTKLENYPSPYPTLTGSEKFTPYYIGINNPDD